MLAVKTACGTANFGATQTILVYTSGGPYAAIGQTSYVGGTWNAHLNPTATYPLVIRAATPWYRGSSGIAPVVNCGGSSDAFLAQWSSYISISGLEITNCATALNSWDASEAYITLTGSYVHDMASSGYYAINPAATNSHWTVKDNYFYNVPRGINVMANSDVEFNEINTTTAGNAIQDGSATAGSTIANNIAYLCNVSNGSGVWSYYPNAVSGNVVYLCKYGTQTGATSSPGTTFYGNIDVDNGYNCHCEAGGADCFFVRTHSLCYYATAGAEEWLSTKTTGNVAGAVLADNIAWTNSSAQGADLNLRPSTTASVLYLGTNAYYETGQAFSALSTVLNSGQPYTSLSSWQAATSMDAGSFEANPRLVGDPNLLVNATGQVFPNAVSIEARLAMIRRNYMPTNLALKGKGCAWNGTTCVPDHSDIGPVPVTVYDAPGITGGGVY
jgi:hypothetical protein